MHLRFLLLGFAPVILSTPLLLGQVTETRPMPGRVTVKVDAAGSMGTVPAEDFGTFIEPIDHSVDNGVDAEILVNGSLEAGLWNHASLEEMFRDQPSLIESMNQSGIPIPWESANRAAGNRFELHVGEAANSWQSLELIGQPNQLTGIEQRVYLPVPRTFGYNVSLYARHILGPTRINVAIREVETGKILGQSSLQVTAADWTKYSAKIDLPRGSVRRLEPVEFVVSVEGDERVELDQISLMPDDAVGILDPAVIQMAAAMNMTELRLGGNFSSYYHWKDSVGPLDQRKVMENISWGIPEYNQFGTDEFLQFCKAVHAIPQFDMNMGSGSPEEAAEWAHYIHDRYNGPLIIEMGNELYGHWQVGYPILEQLPARTLAFSKALRAAAPGATLLATGELGGKAWNAAELTTPADAYDLLTLHFIIGTNHVAKTSYTPDFMAAAAYAVPFAVGERLGDVQKQIEASGRDKVHVAITEWLFNSKGAGERNFTNESPSSRNEGGAVMIAGTFNTYFRENKAVKLVDMTGLMEFAGIWKRREQVFATPAYYAFGLYSAVKGQTILPITTDTGTYSVAQGTPGYAEAANVPYIDVVATKSADGKTLTVFFVNRSLTADEPTTIELGGFSAKSAAASEQITALSRYEMNDEVEPHNVVPLPGSVRVEGGHTATLTLPHESVTRIQFESAH
jgi:alpha-N-arabinofuranosidase